MASTRSRSASGWRQLAAPMLAMSPSLIAVTVFVYGFIIWTFAVSLSSSRMVPTWDWVGFTNYVKLWKFSPWRLAVENFLVFSLIYVGAGLALGLFLAILIDQRIRAENLFRTLFLYPIALAFVVTGVVWRWIMNPTIGFEKFVRDLGYPEFEFAWISSADLVIYAIVIAAIWQVAGFVMVLFLSALRGVDSEIIKAASLDGARPWRIYVSIIIPSIWPVFLSASAILIAMALKTFDLVIVMTQRGPGSASEFPATFMYDMAFRRNQLGIGSASAIMILCAALIVITPVLVIGGRRRGRND